MQILATIHVVAAAIVDTDNANVLLAQKSAAGRNPLQWEFPGGKVAAGESDSEALCREILEELNLKIEVLSLMGQAERKHQDSCLILKLYQCRLIGRLEDLELREHQDCHWVRWSDLARYDLCDLDKSIVSSLEMTGRL
jgi:8-oxo-dGTP diphosphatase